MEIISNIRDFTEDPPNWGSPDCREEFLSALHSHGSILLRCKAEFAKVHTKGKALEVIEKRIEETRIKRINLGIFAEGLLTDCRIKVRLYPFNSLIIRVRIKIFQKEVEELRKRRFCYQKEVDFGN